MFQRTMNNNIERAIFVKFDVSLNFTIALHKINEAVTTFSIMYAKNFKTCTYISHWLLF